MKGQISTIEMIIAVIVLFVSFSILFSGFSFNSGWKDAYSSLEGRDILLSMDRTNSLAEYSFNTTSMQNFVDRMFRANDTIISTSIDGTFKGRTVIACNCTNEQIANLTYWLKDLKLNDRNIDTYICYTDLEKEINPCFPSYNTPDILLIWGNKNFSQDRYLELMKRFLNEGNGIVEIADLNSPVDNVQKKIFGIADCSGSCDWSSATLDSFNKPDSVDATVYQPYKYFYHVPMPAKAPEITGGIPVEGIQSCPASQTRKGNFTFNEKIFDFWICNSSTAYFDTNNNNIADIATSVGRSFNLTDYNFYLNYIIENSSILISFRENYNFTDFLKAGGTRVYPVDQDSGKIFLSMGSYSGTSNPIPVVIVNETIGSTAWVADFSRNGLENVKDSQKQLLNSLFLFVSNKEAKELTYGSIKFGNPTPYLNVMNNDMFEIYKLNLGVGHPF